jgi:hypothetical protein
MAKNDQITVRIRPSAAWMLVAALRLRIPWAITRRMLLWSNRYGLQYRRDGKWRGR